jgi:hypothetical protein
VIRIVRVRSEWLNNEGVRFSSHKKVFGRVSRAPRTGKGHRATWILSRSSLRSYGGNHVEAVLDGIVRQQLARWSYR